MTRIAANSPKIATSSSRPAAKAKAATPKAAAQQPGKAGWGAKTGAATAAAGTWGAKGASPALKITKAAIDEGPKTTEKLQVPAGFTGKLQVVEQKASETVHGQKATCEMYAQQATISGPGGKAFTIGEGKKELDTFKSEWASEVKGMKAAPKEEMYGLPIWDTQSSVSGAGTAGSMVSVMQGGSQFTGGAHPNNFSALATYDARTGKQVKLDELLSPKQMAQLTKDIEAQLPRLKGEEGIDGSTFATGSVRDTINENFALTTGKDGKVKIEIAWESGVHALGGAMAHFTVDAPQDPAFLQKIGTDPSPNTWLPEDAP